MTEQETSLGYPCEFMIYSANFYHECAANPVFERVRGKKKKIGFCICAYNYDMANPTIHLEINRDSKGNVGIVSDYDIPERAGELEERTWTEVDVPKICPKKYTFKQITAKIKSLDERAIREREIRERKADPWNELWEDSRNV